MRAEAEVETEQQQQQQSSMLYELCYLIIHILKPMPNPCLLSGSSSSRQSLKFSQVSPATFASLFLGVPLALMLFGSITFIISFILMPWILGLELFMKLSRITGEVYKTRKKETFFSNYSSTTIPDGAIDMMLLKVEHG